jgi:hypothetical protein
MGNVKPLNSASRAQKAFISKVSWFHCSRTHLRISRV